MGNRNTRQKSSHPPRDGQPVERLESRTLLSVVTPGSVSDVKNGPLADAGPELIALYRDYRSYSITGGSASSYKTTDPNLIVGNGEVAVTVRGKSSLDNVTNDVRSIGGAAFARSSSYKTVDALISITALRTLAVEGDVMSVIPIIRPQPNSVGSSPNQADEAENADKARSLFGLDGSGVKVGVISNTANATGLGLAGSIATGDLPPNVQDVADDTNPADNPTDEGRAMMELIHDIAPGAALAFATGGTGSELQMADNIQRLANAGSNIIVDDLSFFTEPFFQPSVIEDAIHSVTQKGVTYISSAGNNGGAGFEEAANFVNQNGVTDIDFDPGPGVQTRLRITFPQGDGAFVPLTLQWDNPYNGVTGNATSDLDIYFYDPRYPNRVLFSSTANNLATGIPVEFTDIQARSLDVEIRLANHVTGTPLPTRFKFVVDSDGEVKMNTAFPQFQNDIFGHNAGQDVISVGAVPFTNAPPVAMPNQPINNETFSSNGPDTLLFDADGNRLPTPLVLDKPDLSGIDGVDTSFFGQTSSDSDSLPNFFGTSAAAPDVAAVVALIKQADPKATTTQIVNALQSTARPTNSAPVNQYDPQGGFGLIDAQAAVAEFVSNPTATIQQVTSPVDGPIHSIKIIFSQQVSGFDVSDLILSVNGGPNLLTGGNAPTTTDGGRTWILNNLETATQGPGLYTLELTNASGLIVNAVGLPFLDDITMQFTNEGHQTKPSPPSSLSAKTVSDSAIQLHWADNSSNEDGFLIQRSTDSSFSGGLRNIRVAAGTTTFTDTSLPGGTTFFYRIRAFNNFSGNSTYSNTATGTTLSPGEVILSNESSSGVKIVGNWETSTATPGFFGTSYLDDLDSGKGSKSVTYTPNLEKTGSYFVYARWTSGTDRATNVPFTVNGKKITVNERDTGGNGWVLLGKFSFNKGTGGSLVISNAGTNGLVVANAVEFLPAD